MTDRTQAQAVADQIDCDLDNMVRRCHAQSIRDPEAKALWERVALVIEATRGDVRKRMHPHDREVTQ